MTRVDVRTFDQALANGATAFDTRPSSQSKRDPLKEIPNLSPETATAGALPNLPRDEPVYLICDRGLYSELVGAYLEAAGFRKIYTVNGGLLSWRALRHVRDSKPGKIDHR
jgi:rhodanese-related sulfurtransferase